MKYDPLFNYRVISAFVKKQNRVKYTPFFNYRITLRVWSFVKKQTE